MPGKPAPAAHGLVAVARVAKPHGIRGELCMDVHAGSPLLFASGRTLFLAVPAPGGPGRPKAYEITASRGHTGRMLVNLAGVRDRNAADLLRGAEIFVAEADLPPPDAGEEYLHKLLGCRVLLQDGTEVGLFEAILDTPGQLTWVIRGKGGAEILFPAVPEFILGLDAKRREAVIDPPPGLLELYLDKPAGADVQ